MITSIGLKKFKAFDKLDAINISSLTILMGKNSSGKSSIIQSLLLLKQTLESNSKQQALNLEGRYLKYSNIRELAYGMPTAKQAKIAYEFKSQGKGKKETTISIKFKNEIINETYLPKIDSFEIKIPGERSLNLQNRDQVKERLKKSDFINLFRDKNHEIVYKNFIPETITFHNPPDSDRRDTIVAPFSILSDLYDPINELANTIQNIKYLSPTRATPQRAYVHYSENVSEILEDGSNAAHYFWANRKMQVLWRGAQYSLQDAVNECISCVGLTQKVRPAKSGKLIYQIMVEIPSPGKSVTIADVGFGYSQVLPTILAGLTHGKDNLILIEQPEIHLHPSSCANLADLFLGLIQDNRKFLIETHSQDFINRLRLRVIENPELAEKINIVFIENEGAKTKTNQFKIDAEGAFPAWPNGFLDESEKSARSIIKARAASRAKPEKNKSAEE
ncbi:Protein of unknown function [Andreprevotia lacus DSM 23236]|jgi:predicted ATPase|uniref:Endonuclease GajA/Old nuclease/RecF-like AAA domain-containing protein n=1 Tax=Andreprevotia lacus DSM 23236 TaxID=1121001 RepID=A0A1W1XVV7_9NEIS|nr:DUF3696 domain-containing protein [Andreprevotia lacus]SMC28056.1 Protein of unknown function [Andreprevotia lacus DSM 23236]